MKLRMLVPILIALLLLGCAQKPETTAKKIRFGILPIEDSLPIVVAKKEGLFKKHGIDVEISEFNSALERDSALMAKQIDGVITDPLAVILLKSRGYDVRIVSLCLGKTPQEGVFAILASPNSSIKSVKDLNGKRIAISSNTIIEYVTDELLSRYNISYEKVEVKSIPMRLRMLLDNEVDAATLPEPLASYAVSKGARLIISDAMVNESLTQTVIAFRGDFIEKNRDAVKRFLEAYAEAVKLINSNPKKYRDLFVKIARVPKSIADSYPMPKYPMPEKFPKKFYERYLEWALKKGLIKKPIPYGSVIYDIGE